MSLSFKITVSGSIVSFPYSDYMREEINKFTEILNTSITKNIDWNIEFNISPTSINWLNDTNEPMIGIYKKGYTYPSDQEKVFTVVIPIPKKSEIVWGIPQGQYLDRPLADSSKFFLISVDYCKFTNIDEYFIESAKSSILKFLKQGFNLKGTKIRIN